MMKINLSRRFFALLIASILLCTMVSCGSEKTDSPVESEKVNQDEPVAEPTESYDDICELFKDVCSESEVIVLNQQNRLHVRIITKLQPNEKPDGWDGTLERFGSALSEADNNAASHGASAVSAQIESSDETILSSGYGGTVKFDIFEEKDVASKDNPPSISKFEYDQISVGMTLSQVQEIIGGDGTLQSEIGTAGSSVGVIRTYRWIGEGRDGAYADIIFDNYQVYSKQQIWLE